MCNSLFQINDDFYTYTYACNLEDHDASKFHVCDHIVIKDVGMGSNLTYKKKDVIHWSTNGAELKVLEKVFPVDVLTGDTHAIVLGKESSKHAGVYVARLNVCIRLIRHRDQEGGSDMEEKVYDTINLIWR